MVGAIYWFVYLRKTVTKTGTVPAGATLKK
jgi:hypothetical protein